MGSSILRSFHSPSALTVGTLHSSQWPNALKLLPVFFSCKWTRPPPGRSSSEAEKHTRSVLYQYIYICLCFLNFCTTIAFFKNQLEFYLNFFFERPRLQSTSHFSLISGKSDPRKRIMWEKLLRKTLLFFMYM